MGGVSRCDHPESLHGRTTELSDGLLDHGRVVVGLGLVDTRDLEEADVGRLEAIDPSLQVEVF